MIFRLLFLLFVLQVSMAAPAAAISSPAEPKYYFTLDTNARYQLVPSGLISPEAAEIANCYRLTTLASGQLSQIDYLKAGVLTPDPLFNVARIVFDYAPGNERRRFLNAQNRPMANILGVYGEDLILSPQGNVIKITNLDAQGKPLRDGIGVTQYVRTLDDQGRVMTLHRLNENYQPITDEQGFYETRSLYDNLSNTIDLSNYDASGQRLNNKDGIASLRWVYTLYPDTKLVMESYFDAQQMPAVDPESGAHLVRKVFDNRDFLISESYLDDRGGAMLNRKTRIHEHRLGYDDAGNIVTQEYFDNDGQRKELKTTGYAKVDYSYDSQNRIVEKRFFGEDGFPVISRFGAAIIHEEYDDQGRLAHRQFYDEQHRPITHSKYGAVAVRLIYQANGRTLYSLRDANDRPVIDPVHGYAAYSAPTDVEDPPLGTVYYFDAAGHRISPLRYKFLNPYLAMLHANRITLESARIGLSIVLLGCLITAILALRKAFLSRRRQAIISSGMERVLALAGILLIGEGAIRFGFTIWWFLGYSLQMQLSPNIALIEPLYFLYFAYRFLRLRRTLRIYNINKPDLLLLIERFFGENGIEAVRQERPLAYQAPSLKVRIKYLRSKRHAALAFRCTSRNGVESMKALCRFLREQIPLIEGPARPLWFRLYYPVVAVGYSTLLGVVLYAYWRLFWRG